jgi:hypothetical protein
MGWFSRSDDRARMTDEQAIQRYRYMLKTAPPDAIEQAHAEAFAQLTPAQRAQVLEHLAAVATPAERRQLNDDPRSLARLATRTELRRPGMLERLFGSVRGGGGPGMGGMLAGSLLGSIAGTFIGSAIAHSMFDEQGFAQASDLVGDGGLDPAGFDLGEELSPDAEAFDADLGGGMDDLF